MASFDSRPTINATRSGALHERHPGQPTNHTPDVNRLTFRCSLPSNVAALVGRQPTNGQNLTASVMPSSHGTVTGCQCLWLLTHCTAEPYYVKTV